jgi:hypothetical protein
VQVVDSGPAIARRTHAVLAERGLSREASAGERGTLSVMTSGDAGRIGALADQLLGLGVTANALQV